MPAEEKPAAAPLSRDPALLCGANAIPKLAAGIMVSEDFVPPSQAGPQDLTRIHKGLYLSFLVRSE